MPQRIKFVEVRSIARARTFLGVLLLLAAVLTWGIGLTLSPQGHAIVDGTEHIRDTVMTFKHNSAIGTLILCAIAAWLLLPRHPSKWPPRDWAAAVLLTLLAASSIYTLASLDRPPVQTGTVDENLAIANVAADSNTDEIAPAAQPVELTVPPPPPTQSSQTSVPRAAPIATRQSNEAEPADQAEPAEVDVADEPASQQSNQGAADEPPGNETEQNQE